jgi:hypothetical protein
LALCHHLRLLETRRLNPSQLKLQRLRTSAPHYLIKMPRLAVWGILMTSNGNTIYFFPHRDDRFNLFSHPSPCTKYFLADQLLSQWSLRQRTAMSSLSFFHRAFNSSIRHRGSTITGHVTRYIFSTHFPKRRWQEIFTSQKAFQNHRALSRLWQTQAWLSFEMCPSLISASPYWN